VVKVPLHSTGDASGLAALLGGHLRPASSLLAPCDRGASPPQLDLLILRRALTRGGEPQYDPIRLARSPEQIGTPYARMIKLCRGRSFADRTVRS
jgi:hypothetical protein